MKEGFYLNQDLYFEDIEYFVDCVIDEVECDDDAFITVIAKFDEAKEIIKSAMLYVDVSFDFLQIEHPIIDGYDDEFILSFWMNDGILEIGCEKFKDEEGVYTNPCGDTVFLFSNCSSRIIPLCEGLELYFVNIDDECDYDECCCDCHYGDIEVVNDDKVLYKINGKPVSKEEFTKKYNEAHCGFINKFNTLIDRLW